MATNLAIEDWLIEEAKLVGKHRTKKGAVTEALMEYIQRRKQSEILQIFHTTVSLCFIGLEIMTMLVLTKWDISIEPILGRVGVALII